MQRVLAFLGAIVLSATTARAQAPAGTFSQLPGRLKVGDGVSVTTDRAGTVSGTVTRLSDEGLVLHSGDRDVTLAAGEVQRIAQRRSKVKVGAIIGLAGGFALGAAEASLVGCEVSCYASPAGVLAVGGLFGAIGMGVGAAIGATVHREHVVFARATNSLAAPAIGVFALRKGAGLRVQLNF